MISFIGMIGRSSGIVRGKQIARQLNGNFFDFSSVDVASLNKIVVFVRQRPPADFVKFLKSRGHIIGYDILDAPAGDFIFRKKIYKNMDQYLDDEIIDFYIVNNTFMKQEVSKKSSKLVYTIPHHTVNFSNFRSSNGDAFKRIGYVGLAEQSGPAEKIGNIVNKMGCTFSIYDPKNREGCVKAFKEIDIGIVYIDPSDNRRDHILKFKPNHKLNNFQSFGIPVICSSYLSFIEFGEGACIFADNDDDMKKAIRVLTSDRNARNNLSDAGYKNAQKFSIESITRDKYGEILRDFKEIKK